MSTFRRKEKHQHGFSVKKLPADKNGTGEDSNGTAIRKGTDPDKRGSLLEKKRAVPSVRKQEGISALSMVLWGSLVFLCIASVVLVWDTTSDAYVVSFLSSLWNRAKAQETHDPLPMNDPAPPGAVPEENLVWVRGGWFWMGSDDDNHPNTFPIHKVYVDGFWMGKYEVTNAEWAAFVKDTGFKTIAEKPPEADQLGPFAHKDLIEEIKKQEPFSLVFTPPPPGVKVSLHNHMAWWQAVEGASWKKPQGPNSSIEGKDKHPVVHISWLDGEEYLKWKNDKHLKPLQQKYPYLKDWEFRLPTEAEWEFAARGGRHLTKFTWGDELKPDDKWLANIWQGKFPQENTKEDGYDRTAPVGRYPPNDFGLHDMAGNVWEWCHDHYMDNYYQISPQNNPQGPIVGFDPMEPGLAKRVQRGGSFLCHVSYCERYLTYARGKGEINSAGDHIGFRVVLAPAISGD